MNCNIVITYFIVGFIFVEQINELTDWLKIICDYDPEVTLQQRFP